MNELIHKCECPFQSSVNAPESWYEPEELKARIHEPHECPGDYQIARYKRRGEKLWLCSACCLSGDTKIR